jgi:hypothetical protein
LEPPSLGGTGNAASLPCTTRAAKLIFCRWRS